jgi:hypothetical protein
MRDNAIINLTGLEGDCMPIDLNIEHLIGELKVRLVSIIYLLGDLKCARQLLFAAKGIYSTWERLGTLSAIVVLLRHVKKQTCAGLSNRYQGATHTTPDTSESVWKVAHKIRELGLDKFESGREGNNMAKKTINILDLGEQRLKSSTLATFNKKVQRLHDGFNDEEAELDIDTIPAVAINLGTEEDGE